MESAVLRCHFQMGIDWDSKFKYSWRKDRIFLFLFVTNENVYSSKAFKCFSQRREKWNLIKMERKRQKKLCVCVWFVDTPKQNTFRIHSMIPKEIWEEKQIGKMDDDVWKKLIRIKVHNGRPTNNRNGKKWNSTENNAIYLFLYKFWLLQQFQIVHVQELGCPSWCFNKYFFKVFSFFFLNCLVLVKKT